MARIDDLLEGYRRDALADAELMEFLALLEADAGPIAAPILADLRNNAWSGQTDAARRARILARILEQNRRHKKARVIRLLQRAAAAAILVLLAGAVYLWLHRPAKIDMAVHPVPVDIAPGGNKATLTLANGSIVLLDSAPNGQLAPQGSAQLTKTNDELVYRGEGQAANVFNTMTTPRGGGYRLLLADGSKVWLNAASSLRYPATFGAGARIVELTGEAYFEVAKDKRHPFIVRASGVDVRVLGTHFDIMAYPDEDALNTTLIEGAVQVSRGANVKTLIPGQQALVANNGDAITVQPADIDRAIAWTTGFFQFKQTDLHTILREIARWYDIQVVYETNDNEKYGGRIRRDLNLSVLINFLEANGIHHFRIDGKKLVVLP